MNSMDHSRDGLERSSARAAEQYIEREISVIPVPLGSKNPNRKRWQTERWKAEDVPRGWSNGENVGILNGKPSGGLVAVDHDVPEAEKVAGRFLRPTKTSGRESCPDAHWWYTSVGAESAEWKDTDGTMLLELRSTGRQTLVAPSVHPNGERYRWRQESGLEIARMDPGELGDRCRALAAAALVARHLPPVGGRHGFALALVGYLLRRLECEEVKKIVHAAWAAAGGADQDAHRDLDGIIRDTSEKLAAGENVSGGPTLDELAPGVSRLLTRWWGWGQESREVAAPEQSDEEEEAPKRRKQLRSQPDRLIDYALDFGAELFVDQLGSPHALVDGEALPLNTGSYNWLRTLMWARERISVGGEALKAAAGTLAAFATAGGEVRELHTRSAFHEGAVYYQLGKGRVVRIDRDGWRMDENPPVLFRSVRNLKPLPDPEAGGSLDDIEKLVNLKTERDKRLLKAYAATIALPHVNRPILQTTGVYGSGKSTAGRVIKRTFDPTAPETVRIDPREFLQKASHCYIVMLDNLNSLPEWMVDTLCRLVTGEGDSKRSLYTDDEDFIYEMRRAVILNGINPPTSRGDAQDRTLPVELERIPDRERRSEEELWEDFEAKHGRLLGAAFDALAGAIRERETLKLYKKPRMADWGEYAAAVYETLGWSSDQFLEDWDGVVQTQNQVTLDGSLVAQVVVAFMENRGDYEGAATDLHGKLEARAGELNIDVKRDKAWPKSASWLWRRMKIVVPLLASLGVVASQRDAENGSVISLKKDPLGPPDPGSSRDKCFQESPSATRMLPGGDADTYAEAGSTGSTGSKNGHSTGSLSRTEEEGRVENGGTQTTSRKVPRNASSASRMLPGEATDEDEDPLTGFLADPPDWFNQQAALCVREGIPDRLLNALANATSTELYGSHLRGPEVLPAVRRLLEGCQ
jgi:Bifunctional DNA primase/polymerase, N-terminal